jgi:hypothetical protein
MELQSTALPTELRKGKLPPRLELGVADSKSAVLTNYTIGAAAKSGVRTHACKAQAILSRTP